LILIAICFRKKCSGLLRGAPPSDKSYYKLEGIGVKINQNLRKFSHKGISAMGNKPEKQGGRASGLPPGDVIPTILSSRTEQEMKNGWCG
jgi:hypothetical protein